MIRTNWVRWEERVEREMEYVQHLVTVEALYHESGDRVVTASQLPLWRLNLGRPGVPPFAPKHRPASVDVANYLL